jgi:hypothetical protein
MTRQKIAVTLVPVLLLCVRPSLKHTAAHQQPHRRP